MTTRSCPDLPSLSSDLREMEVNSGKSDDSASTSAATPSTPAISSSTDTETPTPSSLVLMPTSTAHTSVDGEEYVLGHPPPAHHHHHSATTQDSSPAATHYSMSSSSGAPGAAHHASSAASSHYSSTPSAAPSAAASSNSTPLNLGPNNSVSTISTDLNNEDDIEIAIPDDDLRQRRSTLTTLLDSATHTSKEGDRWYLIPRDFLEDVLNLPVETFDDLKSEVGVLDTTNIVDRNGNLYPELDEPVDTYNVPPEVFHHLADWFGLRGSPVARALVFNQETGRKEVERFPSYFHVHVLQKKSSSSVFPSSQALLSGPSGSSSGANGTSASHAGGAHGAHGAHQNGPHGVFCSTTGTFLDLFEAIRVGYFKLPKRKAAPPFRVWFISTDTLPHQMSIHQFISETPKKQLVLQNRYNQRLKDQGLTSPEYHILVELKEVPTGPFPIDNYIRATVQGIADNSLSLDWILHNGGQSGLTNLGNTCYMNSALQCLTHIPEIDYYFFFNLYEQELNETNPLGYKGQIAISFGNLLRKLYDPSEYYNHYHHSKGSGANGGSGSGSSDSSTASKYGTTNMSVSPRDFKYTVGHHSSIFQGYQQQDSQEFLSWLLDALHEDLNRIYEKPYCEKPELNDAEVNDPAAIERLATTCWKQHTQRNDSIITDLFTGLYQSTLVCPDCSKTSITFDPFNDITLPLPVNKKWYHSFKIVDAGTIRTLEVELNKTSNYDDLVRYLSDHLQVDPAHLFLFEVFNNFFYKDFQSNYGKLRYYPISEIISEQDDVVVYHIPHDPQRDIIIPVINSVTDVDRSYNVVHAFGLPLFVVLDKQVLAASDSGEIIKQKLVSQVQLLRKEGAGESDAMEEDEAEESAAPAAAAPTAIPAVDSAAVASQAPVAAAANDAAPAVPSFDIKYYIENQKSLRNKPATPSIIHIPHNRANLNNLPSLLKHAQQKPTPKHRLRSKILPKLNDDDASDGPSDSDDFVVVNSIEVPKVPTVPSIASNLTPQQSDTEDHEEEEDAPPLPCTDEQQQQQQQQAPRSLPVRATESSDSDSINNVGSLFDSVDTLHKPVAATVPNSVVADTESVTSDSMTNIGSLFDSVDALDKPPVAATASASASSSSSPLVTGSLTDFSKLTLVCQWDHEQYTAYFTELDANHAWVDAPQIPNPEVELSKSRSLKEQSSVVSLYDCLTNFSTPEVLGDQDLWYCPRCQEHKQATKTIQLWSLGDVITIHLKRFESSRSFSDKIDMMVDFPIEGLDMKSFVCGTGAGAGKEHEDDELVYDLIGIDSHVGGLGGGHYTSYAKNFRDGHWYYFNDSRVQRIEDPKNCMSNAYLLFYRKRKPQPSSPASIADDGNDGLWGGDRFHTHIAQGKQRIVEELDALKHHAESVRHQVDSYSQNEDEIEDAKRKLAEHQLKQEQLRRDKEAAAVSAAAAAATTAADAATGAASSAQIDPLEAEAATSDPTDHGHEIPIPTARTLANAKSKKSRSSIDPSEVSNEDINIALGRKQRIILKDNRTIGVKSTLDKIIGESAVESEVNSPLSSSSSEENIVSDNPLD